MTKTNKSGSKVTIKIPRPIYDKLGKMIDGHGYNSVTDFIVYVLRDLIASHEVAFLEEPEVEPSVRQQNQLEKVKARLRALGDLAANPNSLSEETAR